MSFWRRKIAQTFWWPEDEAEWQREQGINEDKEKLIPIEEPLHPFDAWLDRTSPDWRANNEGTAAYYSMRMAWLEGVKFALTPSSMAESNVRPAPTIFTGLEETSIKTLMFLKRTIAGWKQNLRR